MRKVILKSSFLALVILISACNKAKKVKVESVSVPIVKSINMDGQVLALADFKLSLPESWVKEIPSNQMRIAQYGIKGNLDYKVVVSYFGQMDSQVDANIERWKRQFSELESSVNLKTQHANISVVKMTGIYKFKPFPMAQQFEERTNYGMLSAIIPSAEGPYFIKLVAPTDIVETEVASFLQVLDSYRTE